MKEQLTQKSCVDFMEALASKSPTPGGGGAAALGAALGMALTNMVGNLTVGKKKYAEYEEEVQQMLQNGMRLQEQLLALVQADADVFEPLAAAYGLHADTEEEKAAKAAELSKVSIEATKVPLQIAECAYQAMLQAKRIAQIGSKLAVSDAACSALFLHAGMNAAKYNVLINLPYIQDQKFVEQAKKHLQDLLSAGESLLAETLDVVDQRL